MEKVLNAIAMFDILEADIVVFQETKIQRKDLSDDMVLVPGWDCYFSYSGVVIYTRQSACAPIRAEEGVTGISRPPNSSTSFSDLPAAQQIGGYPTPAQLSVSTVDAATLDSEGRCMILEFPAFVLLGVYSPANRDETRDDFRLGFLNALDARIRNLDAIGKRVLVTGDLNISREELDTANAEASMRKQGLTGLEYVSTPARRLFNQLLQGGTVFGERDEGREQPVMWDICRAFHLDRKGMFTCWEQKVNARPANCGSRIDYILCSLAMKGWFSDSNIQEGLMDKINIDGKQCDVRDLMNPQGMFVDGKRQREYSNSSDLLALSGKLIPEFSGRRNIRDMFSRKSTLQHSKSITQEAQSVAASDPTLLESEAAVTQVPPPNSETASSVTGNSSPPLSKKRSNRNGAVVTIVKRSKSSCMPPAVAPASKGQQSLRGFFRPKTTQVPTLLATTGGDSSPPDINESSPDPPAAPALNGTNTPPHSNPATCPKDIATPPMGVSQPASGRNIAEDGNHSTASPAAPASASAEDLEIVHDPVEIKESWSKLFTKPLEPRCEGHDEPCICLLTKKPGMNLGRSFWMCPRPLGPSGAKERNTEWRCQTFIWCSDWNPQAANAE
ncbi:MAG: hypothetical protein Q9217_003976 [Psora testacea]